MPAVGLRAALGLTTGTGGPFRCDPSLPEQAAHNCHRRRSLPHKALVPFGR
jgi:hypothetical protein